MVLFQHICCGSSLLFEDCGVTLDCGRDLRLAIFSRRFERVKFLFLTAIGPLVLIWKFGLCFGGVGLQK